MTFDTSKPPPPYDPANVAAALRMMIQNIETYQANGQLMPANVSQHMLYSVLHLLEGLYSGAAPAPTTRRIIAPSKH